MKRIMLVCWFTISGLFYEAFKFVMLFLMLSGVCVLCLIVPSFIFGYIFYLMCSSPEINPAVVKDCLGWGYAFTIVVGGGCVGIFFFVRDFIWATIKQAICKVNKQMTKEVL